MATCRNCTTGHSHTCRDGGDMCINSLRLELRRFRWTKGLHVTH